MTEKFWDNYLHEKLDDHSSQSTSYPSATEYPLYMSVVLNMIHSINIKWLSKFSWMPH